jgi:HD-like signal output (HDOD) protein
MDDHGAYLGAIVDGDMAKSTLFVLALLAVLGAFGALLWSGRRARGERTAAPQPATPADLASASLDAEAAAAQTPVSDVAAQLHQRAFGVPLTPPAQDGAHREVAGAVDALLSGPVLKPEYAPRRPLLLPKLVQAVNDESVSRRELARLIAQDPALAGNLLRLANSAFYRVNSQPVESLDRAVALLGTSGIRSLMAAALMQPVFRTAAGEFKSFPDVTWEHTQYAAAAAEAYAAIIANEDPFAAQLLALLLGLGRILVFRAALDQYVASEVVADAGTVEALIAQHEAAVATRVAQSWELSERIVSGLEDQAPQRQSAALTPLGQALRFGRYCGAVAVLRHAAVLDDDAAVAALRAGGFGGPAIERIWARLAKQLEVPR